MARTLASVAAHVSGQLVGQDAPFADVTLDTRRMNPGALFVAIPGRQVDGNRYVADACANGAVGALVSELTQPLPIGQICVPDTRLALAQMAQAWRSNFALPVIGVTGSNGKTTVKELSAGILRVGRRVCMTEGNLNNELGVPLTLMRLTAEDEVLVVELGANHAGDIDNLSTLARPTVGLITNANPAHLEGFGSLEGIALAKGELLDHLPRTGTAVLNADDRFCAAWSARARSESVVTFGFAAQADCRLDGEPVPLAHGFAFRIRLFGAAPFEVELPLLGRHNIANALAAVAAASVVGASIEEVVAGLAQARAVRGRLMLRQGVGGATLIDDSYNANPASVRAALDHLSQLPGRRVLVLGGMAELGAQAEALHSEIGAYARTRCDDLFTIGELARAAARGFGAGARAFTEQGVAEAELRALSAPGVTILIKGSRASGLERLVAALAEPMGTAQC
jgi:UDP-N-acetylmuramoyl-tripeptide--D-alanyl-D-alanine ligase